MKDRLIKVFKEKYGDEGEIRVFFAPGRVNLIGEYTDFNGGYVFPCALTIGTYAVARKRRDRTIRFYSENFMDLGIIETDLDDLIWKEEDEWTNYPKGVVWSFIEKGYKIDKGFDLVLFGNIPNGSGLSSSASVEVVTGIMLKNLFDIENLSNEEIALIGQFAENKYNNVQCGIMDQFIIAMGKKDTALLLDTERLDYSYVPLKLEKKKIVISNSNKKRTLGESKYNQRRAECEAALRDLKSVLNIETLCDLSIEEFEINKHLIKDEISRKRAKHAIYENQRTLRAAEALKAGELVEFGKLMNESHISLRDDFEVSGKELDALVEASWRQKGVVGSRMTGAGFGGCTVSIIEESMVDDFKEKVFKEYKEAVGYEADFYVVDIGDGCKEI